MTNININGVKTITRNINNIVSVDFDYLGNKVYSAQKVRRLYAVYLSSPIVATSSILRWNSLIWGGEKDSNTEVYFYLRSASSEEALLLTEWSGPYLNTTSDISDQSERFLQVLIVLKNNGVNNGLPRIDSMSFYYFVADNAARFYTKLFNIGFTPKHAVLTYNADEPDDAIIRFAISGEDTADTSKYQYINPNQIERLDALTYLSKNVKIMVEITGSSESATAVHEFAIMFGGDEATRLNKPFYESSSTSTSTSSSLSSESSSDSLDSSSSSSGGTSSTSSSTSGGNTTSSSSSSIDSSSSESSSSMSVVEGIWPPVGV